MIPNGAFWIKDRLLDDLYSVNQTTPPLSKNPFFEVRPGWFTSETGKKDIHG